MGGKVVSGVREVQSRGIKKKINVWVLMRMVQKKKDIDMKKVKEIF